MDKIVTHLGVWQRNRYERQDKFRTRVNYEFREKVKSMFKYDFKGKGYSGVIIKFPLLDLNGFVIYKEEHDLKIMEKIGIRWKYIDLKIKFVEVS